MANETDSVLRAPEDVQRLGRNLVDDGAGIFRVAGTKAVSYPDQRHDVCFAIEAESFWFRHRLRCVVRAVDRHPPGGLICDVGGGNGYMTEGLRKAGFDTLLIEPGERGAGNARQRGIQPVVCAGLEQIGLPARSIAAVGLFDVVEHLPDDEAFMRMVAELVLDSGLVYLTVPAFNWLWSMEDEHAGHHRRYTLRSVAKLLTRSGFDLVYATYFFSLLPAPIAVLRTLPYRLGSRAERDRKRRMRDHGAGRARSASLLERSMAWEAAWIERGRRIPIGSSCLVIARSRKDR